MRQAVEVPSLAAAAALAALHVLSGRLRFLDGIPRSRWLSVAGGISVAYVVVHLLPELAEYQEPIRERAPAALAAVERHVYVLTLVGLATFYGVERWSRSTRSQQGRASRGATAFSFATYALYNALIGYLLVRRQEGAALFAVAMGLHFVVNDHGLREHHAGPYHRYGRWLVSAGVLLGAAVATAVAVPHAALGVVLAFVGGGTILNVLKEELPAERESRFGAFVVGAAGYAAVLLVM